MLERVDGKDADWAIEGFLMKAMELRFAFVSAREYVR